MPSMAEDIEMLQHKRSPKRRAAAKRLRKRADKAAGPALLSALELEIRDSRTWETQYQMVMAIGECDFREAESVLADFAAQALDATMIYTGLGDALVRLRIKNKTDGNPILEMMTSGNDMLINGAFRAMAMLRLVPDASQAKKIIQFVATRPLDDSIRIWPLAAAAGWEPQLIAEFARECQESSIQQIATAANFALEGTYQKWSPL